MTTAIPVDQTMMYPMVLPTITSAEVAALRGSYLPPPCELMYDWFHCMLDGYVLKERQKPFVTAIRVALSEGLVVSFEVTARVAELMDVPAAFSEPQDGGTHPALWYDIQWARMYIEHVAFRTKNAVFAAKMPISVGSELGTLVLSDKKRMTDAVIVAALPGGSSFHVRGMGDESELLYQMSYEAIQRAVDRAFDAKQREDNSSMIWA